ncbi:MAG: cupredoxin domain-containing protein [Dehalococcoidia bacterium]|nr:cupredoxin domain-containing protein [Dehalococcoidia bacterium]
MKLDLAKLPMAEAVIGFLLVVLAVTFVAAFSAVDGGGGESPSTASPSPAATTPAASPGGSPTPGGGPIAVTMGDNFFDPKEITVPAGATVTFGLTNKGIAVHNMRVAGADNQYNSDDDAVSDPNLITAGQKATLTWEAPDAPGTYDFQCDFHLVDMKGTITVQ